MESLNETDIGGPVSLDLIRYRCATMLIRSILDYTFFEKKPKEIKKTDWLSAQDWFSSDSMYPFSFRFVCNILNISPKKIRNKIPTIKRKLLGTITGGRNWIKSLAITSMEESGMPLLEVSRELDIPERYIKQAANRYKNI